MKPRDIYILAGIGGIAALGLWFFSKKVKDAAAAVLNAPGALGSKIGTGLYNWTHANEGANLVAQTYIVKFPGNVTHGVGSQFVNEQGRFKWEGVLYQMKVDNAGIKYAVAV